MPYNINDWFNDRLDNPPEDAITDAPLNTYNGSEYVINGVTYRNLEAQVKHNQDSDIELSDRIDTAVSRIETLEGKQIYWVQATGTTVTSGDFDDAVTNFQNGGLVILALFTLNTATIYYAEYVSPTIIDFRNILSDIAVGNECNSRVTYRWQKSSPTTLTQYKINSVPANSVETTLTNNNGRIPTSKAVQDALTSNGGVFWCTHGTTTDTEIQNALDAGKLPVVLYNGNLYVYYWTTAGYRYFMSFVNNTHSRIMMT